MKMLALIAVLLSTSPAAAERPKIAIMPLAALNIDKSVATIMEQILVAEVGKLSEYEVISAAEINAVIGMERMKDAMGCTDAACAAEIGGALDASLMITGSIGKLGSNLTVNLVLFDVSATTVKERVLEQTRNDENLYAGAIGSAAERLFPQLAKLRQKTGTATDSSTLAVGLVKAQQQLDKDTRLASEQRRLYDQLTKAMANPALHRSRKLELIDAYLSQSQPGSELHVKAQALRDYTRLGVGGVGNVWVQGAFAWPAGGRIEIARLRWAHFQFAAAVVNIGWSYATNVLDRSGLYYGGGIAGLGAKGHGQLGSALFEFGFMAWPLYFGKWFQDGDDTIDRWDYDSNRGIQEDGTFLSSICPYLALNFQGVHVELGAQLPVIWQNATWFGGVPPLIIYIGGGY